MTAESATLPKRDLVWLLSALLVFLFSHRVVLGEMRLPAVFSDHMVLQQGRKIAVWGWADPGERVQIFLGQSRTSAVTDGRGRWVAHLGPQRPGGPHELEVAGAKNSTKIRDVLIGEVWLCSGQSNMQFALRSALRAAVDLPQADHPHIRLLQIPKRCTLAPTDDVDTRWAVCTPRSAADFSAVAYYFGLELQKRLKVPVGLIASSWGGTNAEEWTSAGFLAGDPDFEAIHSRWAKSSPENQALFREPSRFDVSMDDVRLIPASEGRPDLLVDDFADRNLTTVQGGTWSLGESAPTSTFRLTTREDQTLRISGDLRVSDQALLELLFAPSGAPLDLSAYRAVSFRLRGRGFVKVHFLQPSITDWDNYVATPIAVSDEWQTIRLEFDDLRQAGWGVKQPFTRSSLTGMLFEFVPGVLPVVRPPSGLFNGMIAPLVPYTLRGFAWYQGEGNAGRSYQYRKLLPALIRSWRSAWDNPRLWVLVVQLPNYRERRDQPGESGWAELREAQLQTMRAMPRVGLAVTIDLGQAEDVHPKDKSEVGRRLALSALGEAYRLPVVSSGPTLRSWRIEGREIRLRFGHAGGELTAKGGLPLRGFAIAGPDRKFYRADARIEGGDICVSAAAVTEPAAVRYAWADNPECNLYNKEGLPASPFRTDDWPGVTFQTR
jgi:sialate O-acetylesterase